MLACVLALSFAACGSIYHYKITDPSTGKIYYTQKVEKKGSAIEFKDANSGGTVTLQNSEVLEISKKEYKANTPD